MHNQAGESILAWMSLETAARVQLALCWAVLPVIAWVCGRLGGRVAAVLAIAWWLAWPTPWRAAANPYYYFWPIPATVALAALWTWKRPQHPATLAVLVLWQQLRATAVGVMLVAPWGWTALVIALTAAASGHGRTQVWHDLLIGIGRWPNPYDIVYADEFAAGYAAAFGVGFKTPAYEPLLREAYLRIALHSPWLIARNWVLNTIAGLGAMSLAWRPGFAWVAPLAAWTAWRDRGVYRALFMVWVAQCVTLGFVTLPMEGYLWETTAMLVMLGSVAIGRLWNDDVE